MIPIRDSQRSQSTPIISISIICACTYIFYLTLALHPEEIPDFFNRYGLIPAGFSRKSYLWNSGIAEIPGSVLITTLFLHGSLLHILANMWSLWIFGDNVEDKFGHIRFFIFYMLCGVIASLGHVWFQSDSPMPTVGASGAIAGVMGAYLTMFPTAKVLVLIPLLFWPLYIEVPAVLFVGLWAYTQVIEGLNSIQDPALPVQGGIAWWAHVGGFVSGILLTPFFRRTPRNTNPRM
jgi:membrane associated rhomboid family serine protease